MTTEDEYDEAAYRALDPLGHFGGPLMRAVASALRAAAANALIEANIVYHAHGVPGEHVAAVELRARAAALRGRG